MTKTRNIEHHLGHIIRRRLPGGLGEFVMFGLNQGWAALFGGLMLLAILATAMLWPDGAAMEGPRKILETSGPH